MKRPLKGVYGALLVGAMALGLMPAAFAGPTSVSHDATENRLAFDYDASSGTVTARSSYRRASRDEVRFEVGVVESDGYGSGLVGKLRLRLEGDGAVTYDGWFEITITDDSGDVAYRQARPASIRLQPRPGRRKAAISYRVDLPTGSYDASGTFEQDPDD